MKFNFINFLLYTTFSFIILSAIGCRQTSKDKYPVYEGDDLELTYTPEKSTFRLWAPTAQKVELRLYADGRDGEPLQTIVMKHAEQGTWLTTVDGNLVGMFYTFRIKYNDNWLDETPGIWAKAIGVNGDRAAIIDMSKTNPQGWDNDVRPPLKNFTDIILYEVHHRDFSIDPSSGNFYNGKYLAMTQEGTRSPQGESTGIDHLKDLGVTHLHILPSYDYNSIDETTPEANKYNWGYDPKNYNAPEGTYSTNASDPTVRIREMKEMVQALHKAGFRVVMDVVYNHTATNDDSNFSLTVPEYFYRYNDDCTYSDASGCGNETASEREMMRKYIIESVKYWAKEYHIDGFRFDLMGIHDTETMNQVAAALHEIDPTIFIYGEGWTSGGSPLAVEKRAVKANAPQLNGVAVFNDDMRDGLKGSYSDIKNSGFVSGAADLEESVRFGIAGAGNHPNIDYSIVNYSKAPYANNPTQVINYVSCHDDPCLVDKITFSTPEGTTLEQRKRINKLAQTAVFTAQGVPFIFAGEEVYRTKKGVHNSYQSPDSINAIDWNFKTEHKDIYNYYKDLIALRKAHPAFRMASNADVQKHLHFLPAPKGTVIYTLTDNANGDEWKNIIVILNGNFTATKVDIPKGKWNVVARDGKINLKGMGSINGGTITAEPSSAIIAYQN